MTYISNMYGSVSITQPAHSPIVIQDANNNPIFEITYDGRVLWHAEDKASEAAEIFCDTIEIGIEHIAGIRKNRREWEEDHRSAIKKALREGTLDEAKVDEIFDRLAFHERLKGDAFD